MSLSEDSKAERKLKAIRRAQFRLGQRLEAIDWEYDVLMPEIRNLKAGKPVMGLNSGISLEFEAVDANHRAAEATGGDAESRGGVNQATSDQGQTPPDAGT